MAPRLTLDSCFFFFFFKYSWHSAESDSCFLLTIDEFSLFSIPFCLANLLISNKDENFDFDNNFEGSKLRKFQKNFEKKFNFNKI